jgi:hydroxyacylglutathione hydrolase
MAILKPDASILVERLVVGPTEENSYVLGCPTTRKAVFIDPGGDVPQLLRMVQELKLDPIAILQTHGHADHIGGISDLKAATGLPVLIHAEDAGMLTDPERNLSAYFYEPLVAPPADQLLNGGQTLEVGGLTLVVLHTPGHTFGGCSFKVDRSVFTGDALFAGSIGRTDFPGGSERTLLKAIREQLLTLPDETTIYPGHGPSSTIGEERRYNPFLQKRD